MSKVEVTLLALSAFEVPLQPLSMIDQFCLPRTNQNQSAVNSAAVGNGNTQKDPETDLIADADFLNAETKKAFVFLEKQGFSVVAGRGLEPRTHGFSVHCSTN